MGSLWHWDISPEFVKRFPVFIETGYGTGNGLEKACQCDFKKIYSIEIWPEAAEHGRQKFSGDPRVEIIQDDSARGIQSVLGYTGAPVFFWLDAHFPGADCFNQPFDATPPPTRLPLSRELRTIRIAKPAEDYAILIDDLRYFADLPWGQGPARGVVENALSKERSLDFLAPFCETHTVEVFLNDKGFALISPRNAPQLRFIGEQERG